MIWFSYLPFSIPLPSFIPPFHATYISVRYRLIEYSCCTRYAYPTLDNASVASHPLTANFL